MGTRNPCGCSVVTKQICYDLPMESGPSGSKAFGSLLGVHTCSFSAGQPHGRVRLGCPHNVALDVKRRGRLGGRRRRRPPLGDAFSSARERRLRCAPRCVGPVAPLLFWASQRASPAPALVSINMYALDAPPVVSLSCLTVAVAVAMVSGSPSLAEVSDGPGQSAQSPHAHRLLLLRAPADPYICTARDRTVPSYMGWCKLPFRTLFLTRYRAGRGEVCI